MSLNSRNQRDKERKIGLQNKRIKKKKGGNNVRVDRQRYGERFCTSAAECVRERER